MSVQKAIYDVAESERKLAHFDRQGRRTPLGAETDHDRKSKTLREEEQIGMQRQR